MARVIGFLGFASGFLIISRSLRGAVIEVLESAAGYIQGHTPYSYGAILLAVFGGVALTVIHGSNPR